MTDNHLVAIDAQGVATVTLNRPEVHNAFDDALIAALTATFQRLGADPKVRVVVLRGAGKSFCAGGDLGWMQRMASYSDAENVADATRLAEMLRTWDTLPRPTIAAVHGSCFAGAMGLVAGADIALASEDAVFCLSEVRLGLVPATISPYVLRAMGPRAGRRYFLTAERFSAAEALRLGFVHEVVGTGELDPALAPMLTVLGESATSAQARTKELIANVAGHPISDALIGLTARVIAEARASDEAREGLAAFFEKRKPSWRA
jgi:methylglutaconyl-CoA hydratase